jgi:Tfp pilus assembly protein PilZ
VGSNPSNPANRLSSYEVALGTNSNSNFYKGLSPGDLLESGGLFIATYNIPDLGARVDLKVTMPGGYEFAAEGLVAWTRDTPPASNNANLSPPGFGVRLKLLSTEARALVHRYARNREPFFYDDI